jgi:DNA-binding NtrC family response regulator
MAGRVLVVSPVPVVQRQIQLLLDPHGFLVAAAATRREALELCTSEPVQVLLVDLRHDDALGLLSTLASAWDADGATGSGASGPPPCVALVDDHDRRRVRAALEAGAVEVVSFDLLDRMLVARLRSVLVGPARAASELWGGDDVPDHERRIGRRKGDVLVGQSPQMVALVQQIDAIAKTDLGVAIYGETGTGKELVARTLHARSLRHAGPLVVANCTALPEPLFENELFGHERGAFTGADRRQPGLLDEATGGTLVLDEIGDVAPGIQAKLLRLLQFHEYKRVGGTKTLKADVRILTTTHRDLGRAVEEGRFREDLYYRLHTLQLKLPALRDRLDDVPLLVDHFVRLFNARERRDFVGFTAEAVRRLQEHGWPGNVREMQGVVERSLVMAGTQRLLGAELLQLAPRPAALVIDTSRPFSELRAEIVEQFERRYLEALLRATSGNLSRAARRAGHERKSLWRLLQRYRMNPRSYRSAGGAEEG